MLVLLLISCKNKEKIEQDEASAKEERVSTIKSDKPIIAFDEKTLRGASKKREDNLHLVSAFDCESGLTLYQRTVESKSNEIPAVRAL